MSDPKYGPNEDSGFDMCHRFADAVPVFIRKIISVESIDGEQEIQEIHCRICNFYDHIDGTVIESHIIWPTFAVDKKTKVFDQSIGHTFRTKKSLAE